MAKKTKNPEGEKIKRAVPFKLTDAEIARKAEAASALNEQLELAVEAKKNELSKHSAKIKDFSTKIQRHLKCISSGEERREVMCVEHKNYDKDIVEYFFDGEIRDTRPMTAEDRQQSMKVDVKTAKKGSKEIPMWQRKAPKYTPKKVADEDEEIAQVHQLETSRKGASSALDN